MERGFFFSAKTELITAACRKRDCESNSIFTIFVLLKNMSQKFSLKTAVSTAALSELSRHAKAIDLKSQFDGDTARTTWCTIEAAGLTLDISKQLITPEIWKHLVYMAQEANLLERAEDLFFSTNTNLTEKRPAWHHLLRAFSHNWPHTVESEQVAGCRRRMAKLANDLHEGLYSIYHGSPITDIVNIGIGGSDLGPRLVAEALSPWRGKVQCHFVSNVDPVELESLLQTLRPESTLFVLCSKTFTTEETLVNGAVARGWLLQAGIENTNLADHFFAVTANIPAAQTFGVTAENCLPIWDWVGGRYSVWSAIGLSCAASIGWTNFEYFLRGAEAMDLSFLTSPVQDNLPIIASLIDVWNCHFLGAETQAVLPYAHQLRRLPDYLQQLTMESNGKRVSTSGEQLTYHSAPILWGAEETNGQHSFHQLLHQGTRFCPADLILPLSTQAHTKGQYARVVANCLAQSRALMIGRTPEAAKAALLAKGLTESDASILAPHQSLPGNRPHNIITMNALNPYSLGSLLAFYEHRTYCSAQLWGINAFDQWGVELGKEIGREIFAKINDQSTPEQLDSSTDNILKKYRKLHHAIGINAIKEPRTELV